MTLYPQSDASPRTVHGTYHLTPITLTDLVKRWIDHNFYVFLLCVREKKSEKREEKREEGRGKMKEKREEGERGVGEESTNRCRRGG